MGALESLTEVFGESGCGDNSERYARELLNEIRREWSVKIREVGTAKGWSTWAAAYLDPDLEFVDTDMPATETIVAELRRHDRAAVLREAADAIEAEQAREERAERERFGYLDYETELQGMAVSDKARYLRRLADGVERGKDTSGDEQPSAGESTTDFFKPGRTYAHGPWQFRCDATTTHPDAGARIALGWFRFRDQRWRAHQVPDVEWGDDWRDITDAPSRAAEADGASQ